MSAAGGREKTTRRPRRANGTGRRAELDPKMMGAIDYKRFKLDEIREDLLACRERGAITAITQLHRLEVQLHDEIEMAVQSESETVGAQGTEELLAFILDTILQCPQSVQDQIAVTLEAVRAGAIVKLGTPPTQTKTQRKKGKA